MKSDVMEFMKTSIIQKNGWQKSEVNSTINLVICIMYM